MNGQNNQLKRHGLIWPNLFKFSTWYPNKHIYLDPSKTLLPASYKQWDHDKERCCRFVNEGKKTKHDELSCH